MEGDGGASIIDVRARGGKRQSVFRSYTFPAMDRPNLTVLRKMLFCSQLPPNWDNFNFTLSLLVPWAK